jgi:putative transposase
MLTETQRILYYQARGLSQITVREVEEMRLTSPSRSVSQRGLKNVLVDMRSSCNEGRRKLESVSCEFIYALELEAFCGCHEYYTQVSPKNVVRYGKTSNAHVDFLVYRPDRIELVECKPQSSLEALQARQPDEWYCKDGIWHRPALEAWAQDRGLVYSIWSPPDPHGIYGANLLAVHAAKSAYPDLAEAPCVGCFIRLLKGQSMSLQRAVEEVRGLTGAHVLCALAKGSLHGPLTSIPLDLPDQFMLFSDAAQAEECDRRLLSVVQRQAEQPITESKLVAATPVDYAGAKKRLARVDRMLEGAEPLTRRYAALVRKVCDARAKGESPLEVCLTRYVNSGRRFGQLTEDQEAALMRSLERYRKDASIRTKLQAHDKLVEDCRNQGIRPPGRATFHTRLQRYSREVRAHTIGGHRAFHAIEAAIDPKDRTLRCPVPGLMVHVDSTKFDVRCSPDQLQGFGFECPTLYVAMDSATGMPLGYTVLFGPSRRLALAVLIRDILHRQGFLPRYWIADGGSEYVGAWFESFCDYTAATRIQPPPGAPRKNSLAENALGRINAEVAHRFLGSTDPDKAGRSVTAKQKSYATACHNYSTIVAELETYLFGDIPNTPLGSTRSGPREEWERRAEVLEQVGCIRVNCMDDFLIATSVPLERGVKVDPIRGVRYLQRKYVSDDLLRLLRTERPIEIRLDCVDPHRIYVRFRSKWVLARTAQSLKRGGLSDAAMLFEGAFDGIRRSEAAKARDEIRRQRTQRIDDANAAAKATKHLEKQFDGADQAQQKQSQKAGDGRFDWGDLGQLMQPFDVEKEGA